MCGDGEGILDYHHKISGVFESKYLHSQLIYRYALHLCFYLCTISRTFTVNPKVTCTSPTSTKINLNAFIHLSNPNARTLFHFHVMTIIGTGDCVLFTTCSGWSVDIINLLARLGMTRIMFDN